MTLDQPDKAGAEHCVCGRDEGLAQRFDAAERSIDSVCHGRRQWTGIRREGGEEGVVVPGHGGMIEEGGRGGVASVFNYDVLCWAGRIFRT